MILLVELAVEQKKGKLAKDALYQYKNIAQNANVGTIEVRGGPWGLGGRRSPADWASSSFSRSSSS